MDNGVLMEIESLRRASLAGLREKFREVFQEETSSRHREHLFRRIAWRLQALGAGTLEYMIRNLMGLALFSAACMLKPHVTNVVVCDPRKNALLKAGNKNDRVDARKLSDLLRAGLLTAVYHGESGVRTLRELSRSYLAA